MKIKHMYIYSFLVVSLILFFSGCNSEKKMVYKEISLKNDLIEFKSKDISIIESTVRHKNLIFVSTGNDVWRIDLDKKVEESIIKNGAGPDQIMLPSRIISYRDKCWVNSLQSSKFISSFSPTIGVPEIKTKSFLKSSKTFDDFKFVSDNELAMTFVYWDDCLLQLYDFSTGNTKKFGNATKIPLMMSFNISRSSMAIIGNKAYIVQSIMPEIQVISLEKNEGRVEKIKLSPSFYIPPPHEYIKNKYDHDAHMKWMASWTSVYNIASSGDWLLVTYKYGYEIKYCYELFNINNITKRYFIKDTISSIYDFRILDNKFQADAYDYKEDEITWKKTEAYLY